MSPATSSSSTEVSPARCEPPRGLRGPDRSSRQGSKSQHSGRLPMTRMKTTRRGALGLIGGAAAATAIRAPAIAQAQTVKFVNVVELSGAGVTSGTNWRDGIELAVREINAA